MNSQGPASASPALRSASLVTRQVPLTVVIVDPDTRSALSLADAVQGILGPVAIVPSAEAALEAIRLRIPDVLVTELGLPGISGIELIARLRTTPTTQRIMLLAVTASTAVTDKIAAFRAGADDYLVKPVPPQLFLMHVQLLSRFRQFTRY